MVQAQSHFAKKVELDGYRFDSQKEAAFYERYVKPSGYKFECQKNFVLMDKYEGLGVVNLKRTAYRADFVIYNEDGTPKHVYDVKNGFSDYAIKEPSSNLPCLPACMVYRLRWWSSERMTLKQLLQGRRRNWSLLSKLT